MLIHLLYSLLIPFLYIITYTILPYIDCQIKQICSFLSFSCRFFFFFSYPSRLSATATSDNLATAYNVVIFVSLLRDEKGRVISSISLLKLNRPNIIAALLSHLMNTDTGFHSGKLYPFGSFPLAENMSKFCSRSEPTTKQLSITIYNPQSS